MAAGSQAVTRLAWPALVAALACGCATVRPASARLAETRRLFEARRFSAAAARLTAPELQKLRSNELPRAYELLGRSQEALGTPDLALRTYQLAVALFPRDLPLLTQLGNLLYRSGLDGQARPYYERILKIHPNNAAAHFGLAETERRLGFLDRAEAHYEATLKDWGDQPDIWRDYAEVLGDRGRLERALQAIGRSLELADRPQARVDQARLLWKAGRRPEAFASLARAQGLEPQRLDLVQQQALWQLETGDLPAVQAACEKILVKRAGDPLALWLRASVALRHGRPSEAVKDLELATRQGEAPFVAAAAASLLKSLR
ncbi:MAG: tetratricopeptide repeat protein [Elusimicrobia bacterium]|nr:tetratricopeptide repeat protein [Elusimicrobiota bacterium]